MIVSGRPYLTSPAVNLLRVVYDSIFRPPSKMPMKCTRKILRHRFGPLFAMGLRLQNAKSPMCAMVIAGLRVPGGIYLPSDLYERSGLAGDFHQGVREYPQVEHPSHAGVNGNAKGHGNRD